MPVSITAPYISFGHVCWKGGVETQLFDQLLTILKERELLSEKGKQRTDSTHICGAIRTLNRLELVGETLRHTLEMLAQLAPQ